MDDYDLLETRVRDVEKQVTALETEHHSVMSDLYGNGQPGLRDTVRDFIKEIRTRDATVKTTLEDHNKIVSMKQNWLIAIGTVMLVIVAYAELLKH